MLPFDRGQRFLDWGLMRTVLVLMIVSLLGLKAAAQSQPLPKLSQSPSHPNQISVMPLPAQFQLGSGYLLVDESFTVAIEGGKDDRLDRAAQRFIANLSRQTGIPLSAASARREAELKLKGQMQKTIKEESKRTDTPIRSDLVAVGKTATLTISASSPSRAVPEFDENESYTLDVKPSGATLMAPNTLGVLHGLETFLQLVQPTPDGFAAPAIHIEDKPRFPWRGLMIDVSRHFSSVEVIKRNIDGMAAVKLNVLHWHLSDDQGFRVESKVFPKLQEMGSDGMYYTQAEIRDVIEYAADRGVRVVPEFDMPGHATAWFVGYPELSSGPGPYSIERQWGIFDPAMDPTREETYKFLDKFVGEMSELFPDQFFHIGGDEVNGKQWDVNPKIQAFMRTHQLQNDQQLQQYFTARVQKIVANHHKQMIGWDEVLSPGISREIVIQSWRGQSSLAAAAKQGYRGLLSSGYYLDAMWTAAQHYSVDPMSGDATSLNSDERSRILGGEACLWAEYITPANIDSRIWPRTAAIAERLWSPAETQDVDSMYRRLATLDWRLEWLGITQKSNYLAMLSRMVDTDETAPLRILADTVRPSDLHTREQAAERAAIALSSTTPLNRMVDTVPPESEAANDFTRAVNTLVASHFKDADAEVQVRMQLERWRDNPPRLQPLLDGSALLKELAPVSQALASLGEAGLQALDYVDKGERAPEAWKVQILAMVDQASRPQADLLIAVAPAVQTLVNASASVTLPGQPGAADQ
jgi:hexosaminidase